MPGGGTVAFVTVEDHAYLGELEHREEAGTPAIVESIRAGLVFQLKRAVGVDAIRAREDAHVRRAIDSWARNPNIGILGSTELQRLAIVSLGLSHPRGMLHPHFVVSVLNDLFGIQARGGCFCAGPYLQRLHDLDDATVRAMECEVRTGHEGVKLGWLRVNFNYFVSDVVVDYIVDAVHLVANEGVRLLPLYRFDPFTGLWHHRETRSRPPISLYDVSYAGGAMEFRAQRASAPERILGEQLEQAAALIASLAAEPGGRPRGGSGPAGVLRAAALVPAARRGAARACAQPPRVIGRVARAGAIARPLSGRQPFALVRQYCSPGTAGPAGSGECSASAPCRCLTASSE